MAGLKSFHRQVEIDAEDLGDALAVRGHLKDTFHEMEVRFVVSKEGQVIRHAEGRMIHIAHDRCHLGEASVKRLEGIALGKGFRAKTLELMGRVNGCTHLTSLILHVGDTAILLDSFHREGKFPTEADWSAQEWLQNRPELRHACVAYALEKEEP